MTNQTYIRILRAIEAFAEQHLQIKKFSSDFPEQLPNFATLSEAYPILFVSPSSTIFNQNVNTFELRVFCYDIIQKDRNNINTILSDTNQILNDLMLWLRDGEIAGIDLTNQPTVIPINNSLLDYVAGWEMNIVLDVDTNTVCEIPFNEVPAITEIINDIVYSTYVTCENLADCGSFLSLSGTVANIDLDYVVENGNTTDKSINVDSIKIGNDNVSPVGLIDWNSIDSTLDIGLINGVTLQVGQEMHIYGKAQGDILNGEVVQYVTAQGDHILFKTAVPSEINANPNLILGVATQDISNNDFGYVTVYGKVRELNTSSFNEGDILYFQSSGITDGQLTTTKPTGPLAKIEIGIVLSSHITQGVIFVSLHILPLLGDIQNVEINNPLSGQTLVYDSALQVWSNQTVLSPIAAQINNGYEYFNDFEGIITTNYNDTHYLFTVNNLGAMLVTSDITYGVNDILRLATASSANAISMFYSSVVSIANATNALITSVRLSALSDGTDDYYTIFGRSSSQSTFTTGIYFVYDKTNVLGNGFTNDNWIAVCRVGGSLTAVDTGIAVDIANYQKLQIDIINLTTVNFYIDNVIVATITTNIPTSVTLSLMRITKTLGTSNILYNIDYIYNKLERNTKRI